MVQHGRPTLTHMGIFVEDVDVMMDFYQRVIAVKSIDRRNEDQQKAEIIFPAICVWQSHSVISENLCFSGERYLQYLKSYSKIE